MLPYQHFNSCNVCCTGLKSILFNKCLVQDTWMIGAGGTFVLVCMWLYTGSLFVTIMTVIAIVFSLGISYFMYTLVFELNFFPFMNLLAAVVAIGKWLLYIVQLMSVLMNFIEYMCNYNTVLEFGRKPGSWIHSALDCSMVNAVTGPVWVQSISDYGGRSDRFFSKDFSSYLLSFPACCILIFRCGLVL